MRHVREIDGTEETVIAAQVENECGLMCAAREHSELADRLFSEEQVPKPLLEALDAHLGELPEDVRAAARKASSGSWGEAFGETRWQTSSSRPGIRHVSSSRWPWQAGVNMRFPCS